MPTIAQIKKGQIISTAQVNLHLSNHLQINNKSPRHDNNASGSLSFFIRDGLALGLNAQGVWYGSTIEIDDPSRFKIESNIASGSINPFVRKYWKLPSFLVYAGGGVGISYTKNAQSQQVFGQILEKSVSQNFIVNAQAQLGVIYPVTSRLGLELSAQSNLFPVSINMAQLGLVILSGPSTKIRDETSSVPQLIKGRWLLAGTFNHNVNKGNSTKEGVSSEYRNPSTSFELLPAFFLKDRLLLGIGISAGFRDGVLNGDHVGYASVDGKKPFALGLRPSIKRYFSPAKLTPYTEGFVSYSRIMGGGAPATNSYNAGGNFGLAYLLGKSWIVEARLLALTGGYSRFGDTEIDVATIFGTERFNVKLEAGFKPNFTVSYVFR